MAKNITLELDKVYHQIKQSDHSKNITIKLNLAGELVGKMMRQGYQGNNIIKKKGNKNTWHLSIFLFL